MRWLCYRLVLGAIMSQDDEITKIVNVVLDKMGFDDSPDVAVADLKLKLWILAVFVLLCGLSIGLIL